MQITWVTALRGMTRPGTRLAQGSGGAPRRLPSDRLGPMSVRRSRLVWLVWIVAMLSYVIAIINRSSLSALGPATQEHFGIDATALSIFMVIQLLVYAACQIPVGILLDRYGATALILSGALLMVAGQVMMGLVDMFWLAIIARIFVGAGDACTFICVIRIVGDWFPVRQLPIVTQITGQVGQAGQLIAVAPLSLAVGVFGWAAGFLGLAALGLFLGIVAFFVLRDFPGSGTVPERMRGEPGAVSRAAQSPLSVNSVLTDSIPVVTGHMPVTGERPGVFASLASLLRRPGIRLAYWVHFTTPFAIHAFVLLWGTPFLVGGMGLTPDRSATILSIAIVVSMTSGLMLGPLTARFAAHRLWMVIGMVVLIMATWSAVLLVPGAAPMWLLIALVCVVGIGGPTSMVAFEVVRSHAPARQLGVAIGLVNTGGFTSALLVILGIGLILDLLGAGSPGTYNTEAFKIAMAWQLPFLVLGLTMMLIEFPRARRALAARGGL